MTPRNKALAAFQKWYDELPRPRTGGSEPAKGSMAVGLILLERLKNDFNLSLNAHLAPGGAQIQGASGPAVRSILAAFGEVRPFVGEGGRTNRGTPAIAEALLNAIDTAGLDTLSAADRHAVLHELQGVLVEKVREFHNKERLKPVYDPAQSTRQFISELLTLAEETGKRGPVAQYLVGAKLELRFPDVEVRNESYSAADDPSGQPGDFVVGDTTFHVTVRPAPGDYAKCLQNLRAGWRVYLLVPDSVLEGARQNAAFAAPGRIAVESIETFIANMIDMQATGSELVRTSTLLHLSQRFNELVQEHEPEEWLSLEIGGIVDDSHSVTLIHTD